MTSPAPLFESMIVADDRDSTCYHIIKGSVQGLAHIQRAINDQHELAACKVALEVAGRATARQQARQATTQGAAKASTAEQNMKAFQRLSQVFPGRRK